MVKSAHSASWIVWIGAIALLAIAPAWAETTAPLPTEEIEAIAPNAEAVSVAASQPEAASSTPVDNAERVTDELGGAIAQAEPVEITNIQLEETAAGFTLRLETSGELAAPETSVTGNAAITDIPNAVLQIPDSNRHLQKTNYAPC